MTSFPVPATLRAPIAQLQTDLAVALANASGRVKNISATDASIVDIDVLNVKTVATELLTQSDATVSSPAADLATQAAAIAIIVERPSYTVRSLPGLVNPNLFQLAARYLGDATRWQSLSIAPGIVIGGPFARPHDPQPIGVYSIVVPSS